MEVTPLGRECGVEIAGVHLTEARGDVLDAPNDYRGHARELHRITLTGRAGGLGSAGKDSKSGQMGSEFRRADAVISTP